MRHYEFLINICWRKPDGGSYPRPVVEGFHLTMGWANEGVTDWLANQERLSPQSVEKIVRFIADEVGCSVRNVSTLVDQVREHRENRLKSLKLQQIKIAEELEALGDQ